jgi:hypothetical protein
LAHHLLGRVEASWARADDCHSRTRCVTIARRRVMTDASGMDGKGANAAGDVGESVFGAGLEARASVNQHGRVEKGCAMVSPALLEVILNRGE